MLSLKTAQDLIGEGDVVSEIGVRTNDYLKAPILAEDLKSSTEYKVESWQEFNREISRFLGTQNRINFVFFFLMFFISGFMIANTTIMIVKKEDQGDRDANGHWSHSSLYNENISNRYLSD